MTAIMSDQLEPLFADAPMRAFAAGDPVFHAGARVEAMFFIRNGRADLVRHTGDGVRMILHRAGPGQILGEASAWSDVYHCDAVAAGPCDVAVLARGAFRARLTTDAALAELWARSLARAVQAARLRAEIRSLPKVADRLDAWRGEGNTLPGKGRWQEVAAELGVTRESLYRELSRRRAAAR
jgi:CRP/FNR family transcriptional regulator, dissimilatory nitrate respiration regulator